MSTSVGAVHVDLGLSAAQFNKGLNDAKKSARRFGTELKSVFASATVNFAKGLLAGVGGVGGGVAALRQVAGSVAEIRNEAARAGVTTRVFQEWQAVAVKARIPMDALADAFKELNIRGDEFAQTAKGSAAEAFARLGLTPAEVKERLKDPAELMLLIIERTRQLKDTAAATRIFDELFGGTGAERLVALLGQSTDEIRATIKEAHNLGNVLDDEVINRAAEVDRKFNEIVHTVGQNLSGAIVTAYTALQDFINTFNGFEAQRTIKLDENLAALGRERLEVERQIAELRGRERSGLGAGDGIFGTSIGESTIGEAMQDHQRRLEAIAAEETAILKVLKAREEAAKVPAPTSTGWAPTPYTPPATGGGRDKAALAAEREAEAVRRLIGDLQHELSLVGATNLERDIANALRQAGAAATAEQQAQIVSLITALHAEEEATRKASEAAAELRDIGRDVLGGMINDLMNGKSAADALADALKRVGDRLLNMALDNLFNPKSGGGGLLGGSIIPGILHSGGVAGRDGYGHGRSVSPSVFVGAKRYHKGGVAGLQPGEVPAILQRGEVVLPRGAAVGQSGQVVVNFSPQIDASGADPAAIQRLEGSLNKLKRDLPATVVETVRKAQKSNVKLG